MEVKKTSSRMALIYAAAEIAVVAVQYICVIPLKKIPGINTPVINILLSSVPLYLIGLPFIMLLLKKVPDNSMRENFRVLSYFEVFRFFSICYFLIFAGSILSVMAENIISNITKRPVSDPAAMLILSGAPVWLLFLFSVVVGPFGEEILFRYLPFKKLSGFGRTAYMLLSSLFFSMFHMNLTQGIYTFMVGMLLSYVYFETGRLRYSIVIHMMINFTGGILAPFLMRSPEGEMLFSYIASLLAISGLIFIIKSTSKIKDPEYFPYESASFEANWILNPGFIVFTLLFILSSIKYL